MNCHLIQKMSLAVLLCLTTQSLFATSLTVSTAGDTNTATAGTFSGSSGDLRGVLNYINENPGTYDVTFALGGSNTITLEAMLPILNLNAANTLTLDGTNAGVPIIIDGATTYRGFFAEQGTISLNNFTMQNVVANGGSGGNGTSGFPSSGGGGGGGMGAGAGLFIDQAQVTVSSFSINLASVAGGSGGTLSGANNQGGGGGLGGNGGTLSEAGGGGFGGNAGNDVGGGGGINCGSANSGAGGNGETNGSTGGGLGGAGAGASGPGFTGGLSGGGGGGGENGLGSGSAGGGGVGGLNGGSGALSNGGNGGFGGGGGGGISIGGDGGFAGGGGGGTTHGGSGGFGGGGGGGGINGQNGGFGGGGGGSGNLIGNLGGSGGVGGGLGGSNPVMDSSGGGGGGAGFGGAIFVNSQSATAGALTILGPFSTSGNSATAGTTAGAGASGGWAAGNDFFFLTGSPITFDPQGSTITISGSIADDSANSFVGAPTGVTKGAASGANLTIGNAISPAGTVVFNGNNTIGGSIQINNGTLLVNGTITAAPIHVNAGTTLGGTGTTASVNLYGNVSPGNSIGTLTVGNFTFNPGSNYLLEVGNTTSDLIASTGTVTIDSGATVTVAPVALTSPASSYTIITAANPIVGAGNFTLINNSPGYNFALQYLPNSVTLMAASILPSTQTQTFNTTIHSINTFVNQTLMTIQNQINQLNGSVRLRAGATSCGQATAQSERQPIHSICGQMLANNSEILELNSLQVDGDPYLADNVQQVETQQVQQLKYRMEDLIPFYTGRFYIGPTYTTGEALGIDYWAAGVRTGMDYVLPQVGVGGVFTYEHINGRGFDLDEAMLNLYATYVPDQCPEFSVDAIAGYGYNWSEFHTRKGFAGDQHTARSTPNGYQGCALVGVEYTFDQHLFSAIPSGLAISPAASVQYNINVFDKGRERGAGAFDISFKKFTLQSLRTTLQLLTLYSKRWKHFIFSPQVNVGWQREFLAKNELYYFKPISSTGGYLSQKLPSFSRNYLIAGADINFYFYERFGIETSWNLEWSKEERSNQFYLGFNYLF